MATNRNDIGNKFQNGDIPSQADFKEIFDSFVHKDEDKATIAMVDAGIDDEHYVTPALLRVGLQNIGAISGGGNLPYKQHIDDFDDTFINLNKYPIESSVKVFKNGQLLLEGEEGDYTINYVTAVITFPESMGSRNIEIDYWYRSLDPIPGNGTNYVDLTTEQTIAGKKTFDNVVIDPQNITAAPFYYEDFATGFGDFVNSPNGDAPWVWVTDDGADGSTSCIASGVIGNLSNSVIELNKTTTQESTLLKYWYKTSSETDYDYLHIEVNGVIVKRYAGTNDWTEDYVFIHGIGPQLIKFIYNKDYGLIGGQDKVWIDKVSLINVSEDFIVNSEALFTKNTTFQDGLIGNGLSSFEDVYVRRGLKIFDDNGNLTSGIGSHNGGSIFSQYSKNKTTPLSWMEVNDNRTQFYIKTFDNVELFAAVSDVNFPNGFIQVNNPAARVIIGSHAYNYTDFTFAVNGNTKLDGGLDVTNTITADQFIKRGGSSSEFLKADGSVDSNVYSTTSSLSSYVPYTGATMAVNLGAYDLTVNGISVGKGLGNMSNNTALGAGTLAFNTTGNANTAIGGYALGKNTTGNYNTSGGYASGYNNTTGGWNTSYGYYSLFTNTVGISNVAIGANSLRYNTGSYNLAIGNESLRNNTTADKNTAIGVEVMHSNTTGTFNTAVGQEVLRANIAGNENVAVGTFSLLSAQANFTTALGKESGRNSSGGVLTTASSGLFLGYNTKSLNSTSTNEIVIGANAVGLGDNSTVLGNNSITKATIYGRLLSGTTIDDGVNQLQVNGSILATSIKKSGGTNTEFLKADGSVDSNAYLPLTGGTISGSLTSATFVKSGSTSDDILLGDGTTTSLAGISAGGSSPLGVLDEGNGNGYRLANADPLNFGNIGADAVDLSYSETPSDVLGATGSSAFAMGSDVTASNYYSTVFGYLIDNNGIGSFDSGFNLKDNGYTNSLFGIGHDVTSMNTTVVGQASNIISDQISDFNYTSTKKLFVVGNGTVQNADDSYTVNTRSDAFVVRLNGSVEAPSLTNAKIDADITGKVIATKEWVIANSLSVISKINEGNGNGYRLSSANPLNFGSIGADAVDFSFSNNTSNTFGATGQFSFASGEETTASGYGSFASGISTVASDAGSVALGVGTVASGYASFACGDETTASGTYAHSEGGSTTASGDYSHAEGLNGEAIGHGSHVEGKSSYAYGENAHVEGEGGQAYGNNSHVGGFENFTRAFAETSIGYFGTDMSGSATTIVSADRLFNIGNGAAAGARSNAFTVLKNGLATLPSVTNSLITADTTGKAVVTKEYINAITKPYKVYVALLTQGGTNAPTVIVLENTLGGSIVWSYSATGVYYGTLTGAFTSDKTTVLNNITNGNVHVTAIRASSDVIQIQTRDLSSTNVNNAMNGMTLEIRVYN